MQLLKFQMHLPKQKNNREMQKTSKTRLEKILYAISKKLSISSKKISSFKWFRIQISSGLCTWDGITIGSLDLIPTEYENSILIVDIIWLLVRFI